jgi:uncharacterized membrane protein YkoI
MTVTNKRTKIWAGTAALAACAVAGTAVAAAATKKPLASVKAAATTTTTTTTTRAARTPETPLTGDVLASAKAAAIAKVGGTVDSATTENDSSNAAAAYEVHVTKADGSHVTVILDKAFAVLAAETGRGPGGRHGHGGPGGPGGPGRNGEILLTGDVATKAKAAAVAKVGGTADAATTENDSSDAAAAYEVHVTKADGSHVTVILDKSYAVLSVETGPPAGFRHP